MRYFLAALLGATGMLWYSAYLAHLQLEAEIAALEAQVGMLQERELGE